MRSSLLRGIYTDLQSSLFRSSTSRYALRFVHNFAYDTDEQDPDVGQVFDKIPNTDSGSWTFFLSRFVDDGKEEQALKYYRSLQVTGYRPNQFDFSTILKACSKVGNSVYGRIVHSQLLKLGFEFNKYSGSALINMYAKCRDLDDARRVFEKLDAKNVVSWNALLVGYAQNGFAEEALKLFWQMHRHAVIPSRVSFSSILSCCSDFALGQQIYALCIKMSLHLDAFVASAAVNTFAKSQRMDLACFCFKQVENRDLGLWTALISGYILCGKADKALQILKDFKFTIASWNELSLGSILNVCSSSGSFNLGSQLHSNLIKRGFDSDLLVRNSLLHMYCKCKNIGKAYKLFSLIDKPDVVPWNIMVSGYAQNGLSEDAIRLFMKMLNSGFRPDEDTFSGVLSACSSLAVLGLGHALHALVLKIGFGCDLVVNNSLINMYAKSGGVEDAHRVFDIISDKDVVSWTAMISGLACNGKGWEAIRLYQQMEKSHISPNSVTFLSVLMACSHTGSVHEGLKYFNAMIEHCNIQPDLEHYACMVDLLGRAGYLEEALAFIHRMPVEADAVIWKTLLAACRIHGNTNLGRYAAEKVVKLEPDDHGTYVLLCHMYCDMGRWHDAAKLRRHMKNRSIKKELGCSWMEVNGKLHVFISGSN